MKFQCAILFFAAIFLTVSSKEINVEEATYEPKFDPSQENSKLSFRDYELVEKTPPSESTDLKGKITFQEYQLVDEQPGSQFDGVKNNEPQEPEPYRICLVVRCFPNWSPIQICRCVRWSR